MNKNYILKCHLWYSPICSGTVFLHNHFENDGDFECAILEEMLYNTFQMIVIRNEIFCPFSN